jgi:hypothetical protein
MGDSVESDAATMDISVDFGHKAGVGTQKIKEIGDQLRMFMLLF